MKDLIYLIQLFLHSVKILLMAINPQQTLNTNAVADSGESIKKQRPKDTRLRQQRLPAWQPILDAKTVIPIFASISLLFVPVGIVLIITKWAQYYDVACENQLSSDQKIARRFFGRRLFLLRIGKLLSKP
ncbi:hypothetical protein Mgra_00001957 [Meloidogyne graminicola]|uniref:Uncharacterized protein n=1 Tax=Meloidogyne graminicola TaxID=189291 RepID=A0A8S9ZZN6_9BILA|nr:hypothetical protein Mgra_00001957 [Meloidogyne graminicola]